MNNEQSQSHKARWSVTTFVLLVALIFSVFAFQQFTSALVLMAVVVAIVIAVHAVMRLIGTGRGDGG